MRRMFLFVGLLLFVITWNSNVCAADNFIPTDIATTITKTTSNKERQQGLANLQGEYEKTKQVLLQNLYDAKKDNINNNAYFSPLHSAILAIGEWRIFEADEALLEIIDYTIDPSSLPVGIDITGDFFYPATRTLVKLRVDNAKVIEAIINAKKSKQIALLTWVLNERQGDNLAKTAEFLTNVIVISEAIKTT